ncbi:MAG TPA: hypothetical protein VLN74_01985 [Ilumatobacteraceae bacterium]|nr:hypothetical protein [Ilumatobacteraceae bacterium]
MNTKLLTLAATGVAGITLGLGVGVAASQADPADGRTPPAVADVGSMDEMHESMRDQMPDEYAAACDEMHASMPADMGSMPGDMPGAMNGAGGMSSGQHQAHHK